MSSNTPNTNDQEIDLRQVSQKMGRAYDSFLSWIFRGILFVKRNLIVLIVLFILGAGIGYYLDKNTKVYDHEVVVKPNFGSAGYTYSKIELIKSKLQEGDEVFFKTLGINNYKLLSNIEIEPVNDIYSFVSDRQQNLELIKLMAEDGDLNKIIKDETTSINYKTHKISICTEGPLEENQVVQPILEYLNRSIYFKKIQDEYTASLKGKIESSKNTVAQIDSLLKNFSQSNHLGKNAMVTISENSQLNDVLVTKQNLIDAISDYKINLIDSEKVVNEISVVKNLKDNKDLNGKKKILFPIAFIGVFILTKIIVSFYKKEANKAKYKQ